MKYKYVAIPLELINEVNKIISEKSELGYRNQSEFVVESVRRRLDELKKL